MKKRIEEYAELDENGGLEWRPWVYEKYTPKQIQRLQDRFFKKENLSVRIGVNAIVDLYKRVAKLEKQK